MQNWRRMEKVEISVHSISTFFQGFWEELHKSFVKETFISWFFHASLKMLASKMIDHCTKGRQMIFYYGLDFKAINMNQFSLSLLSFDDFDFLRFHCLIILLLSCVCSGCHNAWSTIRSLPLSLYEIHAIGLRHIVRFACSEGIYQEIASIFLGK